MERTQSPTVCDKCYLPQVARQNPAFVKQLEAALEHAITSRKMRVSLHPMPRHQRAAVHELAKAYGITTQAYGNEPQRRVDLFVPPTAAFPSIRLVRDDLTIQTMLRCGYHVSVSDAFALSSEGPACPVSSLQARV